MLTCSAPSHSGIDAVWSALRERYELKQQRGELESVRRQQHVHWLWTIVEERLKRAVSAHPAVKAMKDGLERDVLTGNLPAEVAARRILDAFGLHA